MAVSQYFRCRYGLWPARPIIRGRFEIRRPDPLNPSASGFTQPLTFQLDTGATDTAVDESFAMAHGFGDFRLVGAPTRVEWFDTTATLLPAWRLYRWVRFRDYRNGVRPFPPTDPGGLPHLEFRIAFLVIPNATITLPLFGVRDMHRYFTITSRGNDYYFLPRPAGLGWPLATDGGVGVREVP